MLITDYHYKHARCFITREVPAEFLIRSPAPNKDSISCRGSPCVHRNVPPRKGRAAARLIALSGRAHRIVTLIVKGPPVYTRLSVDAL